MNSNDSIQITVGKRKPTDMAADRSIDYINIIRLTPACCRSSQASSHQQTDPALHGRISSLPNSAEMSAGRFIL